MNDDADQGPDRNYPVLGFRGLSGWGLVRVPACSRGERPAYIGASETQLHPKPPPAASPNTPQSLSK